MDDLESRAPDPRPLLRVEAGAPSNRGDQTPREPEFATKLEFAFCGLDKSVSSLDVWKKNLEQLNGEAGDIVRFVGAFQLAHQGFPNDRPVGYEPRPCYPSWEQIREIRDYLPRNTPLAFHISESEQYPYVSDLLGGDERKRKRMRELIETLVEDYRALHIHININASGVPCELFEVGSPKATKSAEVIFGLCRTFPNTTFVVPISYRRREDGQEIHTGPFFNLLLEKRPPAIKNLCASDNTSTGTGQQRDEDPVFPDGYRSAALARAGFTGGIAFDNVTRWLNAYSRSARGHTLISDAQTGFRKRRERSEPVDEAALGQLRKAICKWAEDEVQLRGLCREKERRLSTEEVALVRAVQAPSRKEVLFSSTIHAACKVEGGIQLHLSLKFEYDFDLIDAVFWKRAPSDTDSDYWERTNIEKGDERLSFATKSNEVYSIVPYMIPNAMETTQTSWTLKKTRKEGWRDRAEERLALVLKLSTVSYSRYFPFELNILVLKVQMDSTADSGLVNLVPKGVRHGLFTKTTSPFQIVSDAGQAKTDDGSCSSCCHGLLALARRDTGPNYFCRMYARSPKSDLPVETTVIATFIFEEFGTWENAFKYAGVASAMFLLCAYLPAMETGDLVQTGLGMVFADVGLLYVLPENDEFTTTERIIVFQLLMILFMTVFGAWASDSAEIDLANAHRTIFLVLAFVIVLGSGIYLFKAYEDAHRLRMSIKKNLAAGTKHVGLFTRVQDDF